MDTTTGWIAGLSGVYLFIFIMLFKWRLNNFIEFRDGQDYLDNNILSLRFSEAKRWYNKLNEIKKKPPNELSDADVEAYNENIENLNVYWKSILFVIFMKTFFFPVWGFILLVFHGFTFLVLLASGLNKKIKGPFLKLKMQPKTLPPVEVQKESENYRKPSRKQMEWTL